MNLTARVALWVGMFVMAGMTSVPVSAITTVETQFLVDPPLIVTGFQRATTTNNTSFLQLYNSSSSPIDLNDWVISTSSSPLALLPATNGLLAPKHHIVASINDAVIAAPGSEVLTMSRPILSSDTIKITSRQEGRAYKAVEVVQAVKSTNPYDVWLRRMTTTGYSTAAAPFDEIGNQPLSQLSIMNDGLYRAPDAPTLQIIEVYPYASDCAPNDSSVLCSDYIKLYNPSDTVQYLDDLVLRTDSSSSDAISSNTFSLSGEIEPHGYLTIYKTDSGGMLKLTNTGGYLWLADVFGTTRYDATMTRYESAGTSRQGWSYALFDDGWQWTMSPQPGVQNLLTVPEVVVEAPKPCPAGQYRNPDTNRCRTIEEAVNALAACQEGQERNPTTNRCRSVLGATTTLVPCGEGQERNPTTNRCRSIASAVAELIPCDEGYERNPATNRCRKIVGASSVGASLTQPAETQTSKSLIDNPYAIATVIALGGIGYAVYEWRSEMRDGYKRLAAKLGRK